MDGKPEPLAAYVARVRAEKGLSLTEVERRSGDKIDGSYVSRIENGYVGNPSAGKLRALAKGLGISEEELFAVARGLKRPEGFTESRFWEMFEAYSQIESATDKELADHMLKGVARTLDGMPKKKDGSRRVEAVRKSR